MRIARLERVRWHERGGVICAQHILLLQHHGDVEGTCGLVANLNFGMEERNVAESLAERDALMNDVEHGARGAGVCACALRTGRCINNGSPLLFCAPAVPPPPLIVFGRRT
jgi:hypothetical protein